MSLSRANNKKVMSTFPIPSIVLEISLVSMETGDFLGNGPLGATKKSIFRFSRKFYIRNN